MPTPGFKQVDKGGPVVYDIAGDGSSGYCYGVGIANSSTTSGSVAAGAAATGNPVLVGLKDTGGNAQFIAGDTSGNQFVTGNVASGVADAGSPVKVGGVAATAPGSATAGQRKDLWVDLKGATVVRLTDANGTLTGAGAVGNGPSSIDNSNYNSVSTPTGGAIPQLCNSAAANATTFDRARNNTEATLLASAAHTTTQQSADQVNYNGRGVRVVLNVTVASGTGGLQVQIQGKDSISAAYYQLNTTPTLVIATGTYVYDLYPTTLDAAANGITQKTQTFLPRTWRVNVAVGDASSYTYSISGVTML